MTRQEIFYTIERFIRNGIALADVGEELNYRENAAHEMRWDDNLYEYSTEELERVETLWDEVNKKNVKEMI